MVYFHSPSKDNNPHAIHITKLIPVDPVRSSSPEGETKIPEPENKLKKLLRLHRQSLFLLLLSIYTVYRML